MPKAQFMVGMDEQVRDRVDAVKIVTGQSRADLVRGLVARALPAVEGEQTERLARLEVVADRAKMASVGGFVRALCADRQVVPSLEALETMSYAQLRRELK
jgi:hypothetical protein